MPGLLALLLVALCAAAFTAIGAWVVALRRRGGIGARDGLASAALVVLTGLTATAGLAALQPAVPDAPELGPAPVVAVVDAPGVAPAIAPVIAPVDAQLPTLALEE